MSIVLSCVTLSDLIMGNSCIAGPSFDKVLKESVVGAIAGNENITDKFFARSDQILIFS